MNYTGMLAEVTEGVEKIPAAKALGLGGMLKTLDIVGLSWLIHLERVLQLLRYYSAQFPRQSLFQDAGREPPANCPNLDPGGTVHIRSACAL